MKKNKTVITTETTNTTPSKIQNLAEFGTGLSMIASAIGTIATVGFNIYSTIHNKKLRDTMQQAETTYFQAKLAILSHMNSSLDVDIITKTTNKDLDLVFMGIRESGDLKEIQKALKYFNSVYDRYKPIEGFDDNTTENILKAETV